MTLDKQLEQERLQDFRDFDRVRQPGTSHSVYFAILEDIDRRGRYESKKDFVAQYLHYKSRLNKK